MENQKENKTPTSQFLKTDGGKTKSNQIEVPSIYLPKGGGAIKGIDEKFSVNAVNGTASFSIPLPFSQARGASPALSLSYNSGAGNGIFGLGWSMGLSTIKRKTDKELPRYLDAIDSDTYLFSGAEDLVPVLVFNKADKEWISEILPERIQDGKTYNVKRYRPRIEGLFARIERWTNISSGEIKWRVITKDNVTTLLGWSPDSRICDPKDERRIFEWLPEFVFDDKGNCTHYIYKKEDSKRFIPSLLHNKNRRENGEISYTNLYLAKVLYGNKTPYKKFIPDFPPESDYMFQTVFDYGEYDLDSPYEKINDWDFRTDAFSEYKAGFEIRTTRLCKRVMLFHHFKEDEYNGLVKSLNFEYDTSTENDFTFLKSITSFGYIKKQDGSYSYKCLPPLEFEYQKHEWNADVKDISLENLVHAPSGFDEQQYQFTDLFNEGLSGILTEQANGWYYKHNLGDGKFEQAKPVSPKPSFSGLGNQMQLVDLDADGSKQLAGFNSEPRGYFELSDKNEWQNFRNFENLPNINLRDTNTRMLDLNGDGKADLLITEDNAFVCYESAGRKGFAESYKTVKPFDEESGPHVIFSDPTQSIFLADMSGDGMIDIVRIRNGEVCYWPNLGYGKFGKKVGMDQAPIFDHPESFNTVYLRLADIDGSGTTDIIYLGKNKFSCWKNLSGNHFGTTPFEIASFPEVHSQSKITVTDLLGNGVACIVWSSNLSKNTHAPLKYIDLMNSKKPHVMVSYKNSLGKEVLLEYTPSTKSYLEDKKSGKPWITKLHFPVHCISKTETIDRISGWRFVSSYKYHHGYYDHTEREFRGFGMVEQTDTEDFENWAKKDATNITDAQLQQPPVITKTWVHTGAFLRNEKILGQFEKEYWFEEMKRQGFLVNADEHKLPDARIVDENGNDIDGSELDAQDRQEAFRACKSMPLRSEVFSIDVVKEKELTPYSVATHNCVIQRLQPRGDNKHSVFIVKESEAVTYSYERNTDDPRITHTLNIKLDEYGNVLESASVVYRRLIADASLPAETQQEQSKTVIVYSQNQFTNDVFDDDSYRLRLPSEVKTYELKGVTSTDTFYTPADFENILDKSTEALYQEVDRIPESGFSQKRLIEHIRTVYRSDDLTTPLPLNVIQSLALPYESYQLAYTPELLNDIYSAKAGNTTLKELMEEGKFSHSIDENGTEDVNWWIRSGTIQYLKDEESADDAQKRFYMPLSYTDPYGSKTEVKYYRDYFLFIKETVDAIGNTAGVDFFNFRTLSPQRMRDINNNLSEVISDELGLVKAMALMGKGEQADELKPLTEETTDEEQNFIRDFFIDADSEGSCNSQDLQTKAKELLRNATARFVYDFDVFSRTGKPSVVASILRESHYRKEDCSLNPSDSKLQLSFEYSNGLGKVIMKKSQAEPGEAKQVNIDSYNSVSVTEPDTSPFLRWIGNGRTILNNKGNAVKQYEPYFSVSPKFEDEKELVEYGVTPVMYYDAPGRLIKTEMPDGTFSRIEFDSWKQTVYDPNDTVKDSSWYYNRFNRSIDEQLMSAGKDPVKEKEAAIKAARHNNSPNILHFDTLGRPVLSIEINKVINTEEDDPYYSKVFLDTEGNLSSVIDARSNIVMQYKYDMLGNKVYQNSMDAGQRWLLINVLGNPLRTWDERDHEFQYFYDILHRPLQSRLLGGDGETPLDNLFDRIFYGEAESGCEEKNLRGQILKHYDTGGSIEMPEYDFKGKPKSTTRKFFKNYKSIANWIDSILDTDLEEQSFTFVTETDALGRVIRQVAPDGSVITPFYNEAGLLNSESVIHADSDIISTYIKNIDYNEKGQRKKIIYGNDVHTKFEYDKETFRLNHLESKRANNDLLQDLYYTYDAVGNITHIYDKAIPDKFFSNMKIEPASEYTYDALYRLIEATGRENDAAMSFGDCDNWNDKPFMNQLNPGDPMALRNYIQRYQYDQVGNILEMRHIAVNGNWTRSYEYEDDNNRLKNTHIGDNGNPANYTKYKHHPKHGYLEELPHLEKIGWNFKEEVVLTTRQHCTDDYIPETTYYQYDGQGQRIRKITERQSGEGVTSEKKEERIYIGDYELYRKHSGTYSGLERTSLSLMDEHHRFVMIETRNDVNDGTEEFLVRYQLHIHLGSASLELDGSNEARVISYEEYHPYGTTAYQANNSAIKCAAKRYRYTGMERDEESGLGYHSARYYMPWLGRWINGDSAGLGDGVNLYIYTSDNPLAYSDKSGTTKVCSGEWYQYAACKVGEAIVGESEDPILGGVTDALARRGEAMREATVGVVERFSQGDISGGLSGVLDLWTAPLTMGKNVIINVRKAYAELYTAAAFDNVGEETERKISRSVTEAVLSVADVVTVVEGANAARTKSAKPPVVQEANTPTAVRTPLAVETPPAVDPLGRTQLDVKTPPAVDPLGRTQLDVKTPPAVDPLAMTKFNSTEVMWGQNKPGMVSQWTPPELKLIEFYKFAQELEGLKTVSPWTKMWLDVVKVKLDKIISNF